jgi:hypothetical protein
MKKGKQMIVSANADSTAEKELEDIINSYHISKVKEMFTNKAEKLLAS